MFIFKQKADILVNSMRHENGLPILNHCYRRFLVLKEGLHVILRLYLGNEGLEHPDLNSADEIIQHTEQLVYLLFSIRDFDSPRYSDALKIEAAAELFAFLLLYPFDALARDRLTFFGADSSGRTAVPSPKAILRSTFSFANARKAPQRYVDLLFRDSDFDVTFNRYLQIRQLYRSGQDL